MDEFEELCSKAGYKKYLDKGRDKHNVDEELSNCSTKNSIHTNKKIFSIQQMHNLSTPTNETILCTFLNQKKLLNLIELNDTKRLGKSSIKHIVKERISYAASIDLHGLKIPEAFDIFIDFIRKNFLSNKRFLLVITGLGRQENNNTIRNNLITWLTDNYELQKMILYFGYAQNRDGGEGAFCIYLSKFII